jgi:hypothetical protein
MGYFKLKGRIKQPAGIIFGKNEGSYGQNLLPSENTIVKIMILAYNNRW